MLHLIIYINPNIIYSYIYFIMLIICIVLYYYVVSYFSIYLYSFKLLYYLFMIFIIFLLFHSISGSHPSFPVHCEDVTTKG